MQTLPGKPVLGSSLQPSLHLQNVVWALPGVQPTPPHWLHPQGPEAGWRLWTEAPLCKHQFPACLNAYASWAELAALHDAFPILNNTGGSILNYIYFFKAKQGEKRRNKGELPKEKPGGIDRKENTWRASLCRGLGWTGYLQGISRGYLINRVTRGFMDYSVGAVMLRQDGKRARRACKMTPFPMGFRELQAGNMDRRLVFYKILTLFLKIRA